MRKYYGLQYLRGVAAVAVTLTHAAGAGQFEFALGNASVDLFFVLSGLLMVAITGDHTRPGPFLADRLRRVLPIYWLATSVLVAGALLGLFPNMKLALDYVVGSYLFVPMRSPSNGMIAPLLVPGWTLVYEMAFYLTFTIVLFLRSQLRHVVALTIVAVTAVIVGRLASSQNAAFLIYTDPIVLEFAAAGWLGLFWKRHGIWLERARIPLLAIGVLGIVASYWEGHPSVRAISWGIPALMIVAGVLGMEERLPIPRWGLPLLLGDASYSIYVWHTLAISVAFKLSRIAGLSPMVTAIFCGIAGILVGLVAYFLIERPILEYFRRRRYAKGAPIPAGV